jgi:hypothetical protein
MTSTTNTDILISLVYLAAWIRRPLTAAWNATKPERTPR